MLKSNELTRKVLVVSLGLFCLCGCSAKNTKNAKVVEQINPMYQKYETVYEKMSDRFKGDIPMAVSSRDEFLSDFLEMLDREEKGRGQDLSLFYLIDKKHYVEPLQYVPMDLVKLKGCDLYNVSRNDLSLRPDVVEGLEELCRGALQDNLKLMVSSTYRSYEYQKKLFQKWVAIDGLEEAERESAREGTSQHQLGVAIDFGSIDDSFIETRMGKWLNENAWKYGWSLSFPQGYEDVTGFRWECWHFRFIGKTACLVQRKWFADVQQYMIEFIDAWKSTEI